jgi:hypothetical protein
MRRVKVKHPFPRCRKLKRVRTSELPNGPLVAKARSITQKKGVREFVQTICPLELAKMQSTTNVSGVRETILLAATRVATSTARARSVHATHHVGGC